MLPTLVQHLKESLLLLVSEMNLKMMTKKML